MNQEERRQAQAKIDELNRLYRRYCEAVHSAGPYPTAIMGIEALDQSRARAMNYQPQLRAFSRYQEELERENLPIMFAEGQFYLSPE